MDPLRPVPPSSHLALVLLPRTTQLVGLLMLAPAMHSASSLLAPDSIWTA